MTDDPFQLRRFGIYSERDIEVTQQMMRERERLMTERPYTQEYWNAREAAQMTIGEPRPDPSLAAFLAYWTPERIARAKREECRQ